MNLRTKCAGMPGVTPTAEYYKKKRKPTYTMPKSEPVTYTLNQLKDMLQMSSYAVRKLIEDNNIPTLECGKGKIVVLRSAFDEFLQNKYGYIEIKNLCLLTSVIFTNIIYIIFLNKEQ